jgi:hypothetical protein
MAVIIFIARFPLFINEYVPSYRDRVVALEAGQVAQKFHIIFFGATGFCLYLYQ